MEVTTVVGCGNRCTYCPQDVFVEAYARRSTTRRMTFDLFAACLERVPPEEPIVFAGMAEPWMNPECTRMVLHAHQRGHGIGVYTSLVGMGPEDVALLEQIPFRGFSVHLPSSPPAERIEITPRYRATLEALVASSIGATWHAHARAVPPEVSTPLAVAGIEVGFVKNHSRTGNLAGHGEGVERFVSGPIACRRHMRENVLLPNGDVILCCMDYGLRYVLGSLLTQTLEEIRNAETFKTLARSLEDPTSEVPCRICVFSNPLGPRR